MHSCILTRNGHACAHTNLHGRKASVHTLTRSYMHVESMHALTQSSVHVLPWAYLIVLPRVCVYVHDLLRESMLVMAFPRVCLLFYQIYINTLIWFKSVTQVWQCLVDCWWLIYKHYRIFFLLLGFYVYKHHRRLFLLLGFYIYKHHRRLFLLLGLYIYKHHIRLLLFLGLYISVVPRGTNSHWVNYWKRFGGLLEIYL